MSRKGRNLLTILMTILFMGSLWQLEIADNCLLNKWVFKFGFNQLSFQDIWAVRDFFMMMMILAWLVVAYVASDATQE